MRGKGDGETLKVGGEQSYYKNHKRVCGRWCADGSMPCATNDDCQGGRCDDLHFGDTSEACTERPFEFSHVYYYSDDCGGEASAVKGAEECGALTGGRVNTRCCAFKPKVQVLDNWGWCNGDCASGGGKGCYDDPVDKTKKECSKGAVGGDSFTYSQEEMIVYTRD